MSNFLVSPYKAIWKITNSVVRPKGLTPFMMQKSFNTAGPCVPDHHYMIDIAERFTDVRPLIDGQKYFILHAPRQTGKTTTMMQLAEQLNREGRYIVLYVNIEVGQAARNDFKEVNRIIINEFKVKALVYLPKQYYPSRATDESALDFSTFLTKWCLELPKPLVVFMDEVDALMGDSLISVLRQLRNGYAMRPTAFPYAMCLIGLRDIRDYRIFSDATKKYIVGGSAFNIKEESCRMNDFTHSQIRDLYGQHTKATAQCFEAPRLRAFIKTPWVNLG